MEKCVLYDRECIDCGECDRCDLDPNKVCDNCMRCVNGESEYRGVLIESVENPEDSCNCGKPHMHHDT